MWTFILRTLRGSAAGSGPHGHCPVLGAKLTPCPSTPHALAFGPRPTTPVQICGYQGAAQKLVRDCGLPRVKRLGLDPGGVMRPFFSSRDSLSSEAVGAGGDPRPLPGTLGSDTGWRVQGGWEGLPRSGPSLDQSKASFNAFPLSLAPLLPDPSVSQAGKAREQRGAGRVSR